LHYFQIDAELLYWNFFLDFGPLNLGQLHRFSTKLNALLALDLDEGESSTTIVFYSSVDPNKRANAKYLIAAWQMLYLDRTPEEALRGFCLRSSSSSETPKQQSHNSSSPPLMMGSSSSVITTSTVPPFHDASPGVCTYDLTVMDCLRGLAKARLYGFFDFNDFNVQEYEHFEQVEVS
jgi:cell division cycle 14